ncbi:DUF6669 family protein [Faecalicoccus pleomorphus]|uniref:DUF6669 family protein n=1 Tax=Faecalicoccus pleomorphus TaxID=1323 RepID=UPI00294304AE|nr:DUF6669 family protein [Faecalicoccus pleomorphus]
MEPKELRVLWEMRGEISKDWQGDILYKSPLPKDIKSIYIEFHFSKREILDDGTLEDQCRKAISCNDASVELDQEQIQVFMKRPKAELNLSVIVDGFCAGSAHYDATEKYIELSADKASLGFIPCKIEGLLEVQIKVFNVVQDHTPYRLVVKGGNQ